MTTRGPEERSLRKSVDSYSVLGQCLITADAMADASSLDFSLTVNGELRQKANTRDLIIGIAELVEFASSFYTLYPGDLIYTGTLEGAGPVLPGDHITTEFQGIGRMDVAVRMADPARWSAAALARGTELFHAKAASRSRRHVPGGLPTNRLKARANAASES